MKGLKIARNVQTLLRKNYVESEILVSSYKGEIEKITKKLANEEKSRFYSIGGDGTLNDIVTGIIGTDSEIVVIPAGTGNDFSKTISDFKSMRKIVKESLKNDVRKVDVIAMNMKEKYSINILNAGFDANVAFNMNKFRKVPLVSGSFKYNLAIFYSLFRNKNYAFKIRVDDKVFKGKYTLAVIANGKYYGGGVCPAKDADAEDNKLNVCIIDKTSVLRKIVLLPKYKKGLHENLDEVTMLEGKQVSVCSNKKFQISLDGEIYELNRFKCKVLENKVNVVFTKKNDKVKDKSKNKKKKVKK